MSEKISLLSKVKPSGVKNLNTLTSEGDVLSKNIVFSLIADTAVGLFFCCMVFYLDLYDLSYAGKRLIPHLEEIAKQVELLIHWLMGIPIGLKLNLPLNRFLGNFFLHLLRLWTEFLRLTLRSLSTSPLLRFGVNAALSLVGFGFTFAVAAVSDFVSCLTFHVHCFYIYAARLYQFQLEGIISLSRLFRGKKYNPLRRRVDSIQDESGEWRFFAGTIFFALLIFLFPTTLLYYAIFVAMRLIIHLVQSLLSKVTAKMIFAPFYSVFAAFLFPLFHVDKVTFSWLDADIGRFRESWQGEKLTVLSPVVKMDVVPKKLRQVWKDNEFSVDCENKQTTGLLSNVVFGRIIKS